VPQPTRPAAVRRTLRLAEVAEQLGVNPRTIGRWAADGTLPTVRIGGVVLVRIEDLDSLLSANLSGGGHVPRRARSTRRHDGGEASP
jgi:excisionase family DNA binding protein